MYVDQSQNMLISILGREMRWFTTLSHPKTGYDASKATCSSVGDSSPSTIDEEVKNPENEIKFYSLRKKQKVRTRLQGI